jgi:bifunctional DNA-binding transcriptional regulator/antitoxin component of YhaV-PrlF toxin-antitoxin module
MEVVTLSSKGHNVIPANVRKKFSLCMSVFLSNG